MNRLRLHSKKIMAGVLLVSLIGVGTYFWKKPAYRTQTNTKQILVDQTFGCIDPDDTEYYMMMWEIDNSTASQFETEMFDARRCSYSPKGTNLILAQKHLSDWGAERRWGNLILVTGQFMSRPIWVPAAKAMDPNFLENYHKALRN